jgi:hypothetical protein
MAGSRSASTRRRILPEARCHLTGWQHLVGERGWDAQDYTERCVRGVLAELLSPAP